LLPSSIRLSGRSGFHYSGGCVTDDADGAVEHASRRIRHTSHITS
jgi:hypothetical protein